MRRARRASASNARGGFTLLEVIVALAVGAIAIVGAREVLGALTDHSAVISSERDDLAKVANGERLLRVLLAQAEAGADPKATFAGASRRVQFDTWCLTPRGWSERCVAVLSLTGSVADEGYPTLDAALSTGERITLARVDAGATFGFLEDAAHGGTWTTAWGPGVTAPVAIGVLSARDTLIVRVGVAR